MIRDRIYPFVQRGVQLHDDVVLPVGTIETKKGFGLVCSVLSTYVSYLLLGSAIAVTYDCSKDTSMNLIQTEKRVEERDERWLSRRLLERLLRVFGEPVLVVAIGGIIKIKAATPVSAKKTDRTYI